MVKRQELTSQLKDIIVATSRWTTNSISFDILKTASDASVINTLSNEYMRGRTVRAKLEIVTAQTRDGEELPVRGRTVALRYYIAAKRYMLYMKKSDPLFHVFAEYVIYQRKRVTAIFRFLGYTTERMNIRY